MGIVVEVFCVVVVDCRFINVCKPTMGAIKRYATDMLKGLECIHSYGLIHRDLKCENVFINNYSGRVKIGDLGLSTMYSSNTQSFVGTPNWLAPELFQEGPYDEKVDMWGFGMCIVELATSQAPYAMETKMPTQIFMKISKVLSFLFLILAYPPFEH